MGNKVGRTNIRGIKFADDFFDLIPTTVWFSKLIELDTTMDENLFKENDNDFGYYIGIDHGTNKCGVCLVREDFRQGLAVEFARRSNETPSEFFEDLFRFIDELKDNRRVKAIIQELPPPIKRGKHTGYQSIEKAAGAYAIIYNELENRLRNDSSYRGILHPKYTVTSWQSSVKDSDTVKYCSENKIKDNKMIIALSLCKKFPVLRNLLASSAKSKSSDGFDAFGLCYTHSKKEKNNYIDGPKTTKTMVSVYITEDQVRDYIDIMSVFIDDFERSFSNHRTNKIIPEGMTLYEAAKRSFVNKLTVCPITDERQLVNLKWGLNLDSNYDGDIYSITACDLFYGDYIKALQKNFLTIIYK